MNKQQREKIVELYMKAIGDSKLSEEVWKKIAKVNQLILDEEEDEEYKGQGFGIVDLNTGKSIISPK